MKPWTLLACVFFPVAAAAETLEVPGDFLTVQQAILAAQPGDTIVVGPGVRRVHLSVMGKAIALVARDGPDTTFLVGDQEGGVLEIQDTGDSQVQIRGFTIREGCALQGAGVNIRNARVALADVRIIENGCIGVTQNGGGLAAVGAEVELDDVYFDSNLADAAGGGIYLETSSLAMRGGSLRMNQALYLSCSSACQDVGVGGGGVAAFDHSDVDLVAVEISSNLSVAGGGVYLSDSAASLSDVRVESNAAKQTVHHEEGCGGTFAENASYGGGMFIAPDASARMMSSQVVSNTAVYGGGIYTQGLMEGSDLVMSSNTATGQIDQQTNCAGQHYTRSQWQGDGGAVFVGGGSTSLVESTLDGNSALHGGAVALLEGDLSLVQSALVDNSAYGPSSALRGSKDYSGGTGCPAEHFDNTYLTGEGGALFVVGGQAQLSDVILEGNLALKGGHLALRAGEVKLRRAWASGGVSNGLVSSTWSEYCDCSGACEESGVEEHYGGQGGAIHAAAGRLDMAASAVISSSAYEEAGAMYLGEGMSLTRVWNVSLVGNGAPLGAALSAYASGPIELSNLIVAFSSGGASLLLSGPAPAAALRFSDVYSPDSDPLLLTGAQEVGEGNIFSDPLFTSWDPTDPSSVPDLHLRPESPCRDAGDPTMTDLDGSRSDMGLYGGSDGAPPGIPPSTALPDELTPTPEVATPASTPAGVGEPSEVPITPELTPSPTEELPPEDPDPSCKDLHLHSPGGNVLASCVGVLVCLLGRRRRPPPQGG